MICNQLERYNLLKIQIPGKKFQSCLPFISFTSSYLLSFQRMLSLKVKITDRPKAVVLLWFSDAFFQWWFRPPKTQ